MLVVDHGRAERPPLAREGVGRRWVEGPERPGAPNIAPAPLAGPGFFGAAAQIARKTRGEVGTPVVCCAAEVSTGLWTGVWIGGGGSVGYPSDPARAGRAELPYAS